MSAATGTDLASAISAAREVRKETDMSAEMNGGGNLPSATDLDKIAEEIKVVEETSSMAPTAPTVQKAPMSITEFLKNAVPAPVTIQSPVASATGVVTIPPQASVSVGIAGGSVAGALPRGLKLFSPSDLTSGYLHAMIYGETDARKSTTAASFGTPENTRIVLVRRPEQLIPLRNLGFGANTVAHCEDAEAFKYAVLNPETLWPDWAGRADRTLVIDDMTRVKDLLLGGNEMTEKRDPNGNVIGYKEVRDARQVHKAAKDDMYDVMQVVFQKPQHVICTALAQVYTNNITNEETLSPDIPPGMGRMLTTEFEFVFFIDKRTWKFVTTQKIEVYQKKNEKGYNESHTRFIFAKRKLPVELENVNLIWQDEDMRLREIWDRVKSGKRA